MTRSLTYSLFVMAAVATLADIVAFLVLVLPGLAVETNPIVARMTSFDAVAARLFLLVWLGCLTVIAEAVEREWLTVAVRVMLAIAIIVGVLGATVTLSIGAFGAHA